MFIRVRLNFHIKRRAKTALKTFLGGEDGFALLPTGFDSEPLGGQVWSVSPRAPVGILWLNWLN